MVDVKPRWNVTDQSYHISQRWYDYVDTALVRVAFCCAWLGVIFSTAVALVLLSTPQQRRGAIFVVQCLTLPCALLYNSLEIYRAILEFRFIFDKSQAIMVFHKTYQISQATMFLEMWTTMMCDVTLILKLLHFYPPSLYSRTKRCLVVAPLVMLLWPRFPLMVASLHLFSVMLSLEYTDVMTPVDPAKWTHYDVVSDYTEGAGWVLHALYCICASVFLIFKAVAFARKSKCLAGGNSPPTSDGGGSPSSLDFSVPRTLISQILCVKKALSSPPAAMHRKQRRIEGRSDQEKQPEHLTTLLYAGEAADAPSTTSQKPETNSSQRTSKKSDGESGLRPRCSSNDEEDGTLHVPVEVLK